jgi:hypothetical protein
VFVADVEHIAAVAANRNCCKQILVAVAAAVVAVVLASAVDAAAVDVVVRNSRRTPTELKNP